MANYFIGDSINQSPLFKMVSNILSNKLVHYVWLIVFYTLHQLSLTGPGQNVMVSTDGGRYDVDIQRRIRTAIYWNEPEVKVRRASWFYRPESDPRFLPYDEEFAVKLEVCVCFS